VLTARNPGNGMMSIEYGLLAANGAFLVVVVLIWSRLRAVDRRLASMQDEIKKLHVMESRLFIMALNARPNGAASFNKADSDADSTHEEVPSLIPEAEIRSSRK
jgi:type II secretory pathway component PulM